MKRVEGSSEVASVSIDSYINNLPQDENAALYSTIGKVFGALVPQFDSVLKALHESKRLEGEPLATLERCQVIVKLANIVIAPGEGASFPGGHWHLEGMATERIAATGIYYYDMTNVQPNKLEFRSTISDPSSIDYPQDCSRAVTAHYGLEDTGRRGRIYETTMSLGAVQTEEDMLLVFPNFLQHKVSDFRLQDETRPGTRKILCFFLINPYARVTSTAHVAPQQGLVSLEDARLFRELLMFQRKYQMDDATNFFERGWSLCEH